jgi:catechol 2,3-dioxygenase-like lactoylglutathione lyase family enzyme
MVNDVERTAAFYVDVLGFDRGVDVKTDGETAFVVLVQGSIEIMLQSAASLNRELPGVFGKRPTATGLLYIDVDDVEALHEAVKGKVEIIKPLHVAEHGETVFYLRDPNGYVLGFAG